MTSDTEAPLLNPVETILAVPASLSAEASMVFMGNTKKSLAYMLKHSHFFDQLPDKYIDSA